MITDNRSINKFMHSNILFKDEKAVFENEAGFTKIVQHYSPVLLNTAVYITKDHQTAEDIVQETFLRLWEKRVEIIPDNIGGWLYKVVSNLSYKHLKRESCKTRIYASIRKAASESYSEVEERLVQKESSSFVQDACARLPEKQQVVYQLSRKEGLSREEIARQLHISPHTVKNHLARAVQFIKEHAGACCLFFLFFVFNNIFFNGSSTKNNPRDLYRIEQMEQNKEKASKHQQIQEQRILSMHYPLQKIVPRLI